MRVVTARVMILAGLVFAATSFTLGLRLRIPGIPMLSSAPPQGAGEIPFLPAFFILGIMLMFLSAVVYELIPGRRAPAPPARPRLR